jgi:preprotein translocase subunit YajC
MMKSILKMSILSLLAAAIAGLPLQLTAQSTNKPAVAKKPAAEKAAPGEKKRTGGGVHGNLVAVDKGAMTITLGKHTYQITSETKILKAGKPAKLEDGVVGEYASIGYKRTDDGKLLATKVTFGKPEEKGAEKKKDTAPK